MVAQRDALGRFAAIAAPEKGRDGIRGKDRKKFANWNDITIYHTFDDGWFIADFHDPEDLRKLGQMGGGCSGSHGWTIKKGLEHIMALCTPDAVPKSVLHFLNLENAWLDVKNDTGMPNTYNNLTYVGSIGDYESPHTGDRRAAERKARLKQDIAYYESDIERYKKSFEAIKVRALKVGPLGRDNPFKYDLDNTNRAKTKIQRYLDQYKQELAELEKIKLDNKKIISARGRRTVIGDRHFILISCYNHEAKVSEWLDTLPDSKKVPLKHESLPEAEVFPTIAALKEKLKVCGDARLKYLNGYNY